MTEHRRVIRVVPLLVVASVALLLSPAHMVSASKTFAAVRTIHRGLMVQAPKKKPVAGKVRMGLANRYALSTAPKQAASVGFLDTTRLYLGERTFAVLRTPNVTYIKKGAVYEFHAAGTTHEVVTANATISAIGTRFLIEVTKVNGVIQTLVEVDDGIVQLCNKAKVCIEVTAGYQGTIRGHAAPVGPTPATASLPTLLFLVMKADPLPPLATPTPTATATPLPPSVTIVSAVACSINAGLKQWCVTYKATGFTPNSPIDWSVTWVKSKVTEDNPAAYVSDATGSFGFEYVLPCTYIRVPNLLPGDTITSTFTDAAGLHASASTTMGC